MAVADLAQRAAPFVRSALDDDDLKERLQAAATAGRSVVRGVSARRQPPPRTLARRTGDALTAAGSAVVALSRVDEPAPKRRGRGLLALILAGGVAAAVIRVAQRPAETSHVG